MLHQTTLQREAQALVERLETLQESLSGQERTKVKALANEAWQRYMRRAYGIEVLNTLGLGA